MDATGNLILSRRSGEAVVIGEGPDAVVVTVETVRGDRVYLGFVGPKGTRIDRREVRARREAEFGDPVG